MSEGDRQGIETFLFFALVGLLSLFGASAKLLTRWETEARSVVRMLGSCMVSTFVAVVVGLLFVEVMRDRPLLLLGLCGAAGYLGVEIADSVMRRALGLTKVPLLPPEETKGP